jgi:hypothetical protein
MTLYEQLEREARIASNNLKLALNARATQRSAPYRGARMDEINRRLYYLEGVLAAWALISNATPQPARHPVVFDAALRKVIKDELNIDLAELHEAVEKA